MSGKNNISQLVCGIMFSNTFKLFDKWGALADEILYSSSSKKVFGENYYDSISVQTGYQRVLFNSITNNNLRLTQNNLIITHNVADKNFDSEYLFLRNLLISYIFPKIISTNLLMVRRIGIVFSCTMQEKEISDFKKTIINKDSCDSITDFRFSKKEPTPQGLSQKGTDNYINKIITVGNIDDGTHGLSYDYQYHFLPPDATAEHRLNDIFDTAINALNSDIFSKIEVKDEKK